MRVQFLDRQREKGRRSNIKDFQADCLFLVQQGEKGTSKLKTLVLDALGLQKGSCSDDSGCCFGSLAMSFSPCLSRKRLFQGTLGMLGTAFSPCLSRKRLFQSTPRGLRAALSGRFWMPALTPRDCLFPLPVEEHAISVLPGNARDGLSSLPVEEKAISGSTGRPKSGPFRMILDAGFDPSRLPLPP